MPIAIKFERAVFVLVLTFVMCSVSGAIAMQKLRSAEFFEWSNTWYKTTRATTRALPRSALNQRKYTLCGGRA